MKQETDIFTKTIKHIKKDRKIWFAAVVTLLLLMAGACNPSKRCLEETDVFMHVRFVTTDEGEDRDTTLQEAQIYGVGREDSLLAYGSIHKIDLPLNAHYDSTAFVIVSDTLKDTLTCRYTRTTRLLSFECGFIAEFHDLQLQITHHFLDSVTVINPLVTNTDDENVKIYLFRD